MSSCKDSCPISTCDDPCPCPDSCAPRTVSQIPDLNSIPEVDSIPEATVPDESSYEFQLQKCLKELKKLSKTKPSISLDLNAHVDQILVQDLQNKGYIVKYSTDYDGSRKQHQVMSKLRVFNPKLGDPNLNFIDSFEENLRKLGFNGATLDRTDAEENFKKLFTGILKF